MSIYSFKFTANDGSTVDMNKYQGKNVIIVNTASMCGYTKQYASLVKLKEILGDDIEIIAFPCNQFGGQEPGSNSEIKEFCSTNYNINFDLAAKIEVNGEQTHPVWAYLKSIAKHSFDIGWNFEKFLIDKEGNISHYDSNFEPLQFVDIVNEKNKVQK